MNKPKILFVYDHKYPDQWMDGLWAALNLLEKDFNVQKFNLDPSGELGYEEPDFILGWGGFNSKVDKWIQSSQSPYKKGLCIAGNAFPPSGADNYDVLFYETKWYRDQINFHKNIVHAFGVNTDIFNTDSIELPSLKLATPVVWDYIGVGAFAYWKRWEKMLDKKGTRLVIGEYQIENNIESDDIATKLIRGGVMVSNMINAYDLSNLYRWSRICYIPADINGGGERSVWEAKACGLKVEIEEDNPKLKELVESPVMDHKWYAEKLKEGIMSVI